MKRYIFALGCLFASTSMAVAVENDITTPESKARVAAYYSAFQIAAMEGVPSPCPVDGLDQDSLGRLNRWMQDRASHQVVAYFQAEVANAKQLIEGRGFIFGDPAIRQEVCRKLRWEAQAYDLFPAD